MLFNIHATIERMVAVAAVRCLVLCEVIIIFYSVNDAQNNKQVLVEVIMRMPKIQRLIGRCSLIKAEILRHEIAGEALEGTKHLWMLC